MGDYDCTKGLILDYHFLCKDVFMCSNYSTKKIFLICLFHIKLYFKVYPHCKPEC